MAKEQAKTQAVKRAKKKWHPKFARMNLGRSSRSRVGESWRRPRGIDNKQKRRCAYVPSRPRIGYGNPKEIKHLHPCGLHEALVENPGQVAKLQGVVVRIASGVGGKKRKVIIDACVKKNLRVLNA
ncbi:50S ribosomal protein L32e [Candidatus Gugararchaeum adminiculabundum]|nr:50S ribosomal protein L32e [Candidatus Gugararchaeum adminiculabundum]